MDEEFSEEFLEEFHIIMTIGCGDSDDQVDNFSGYVRKSPELATAWKKLINWEFSCVKEIIAEAVEREDPEAIFISSTFSRKGESEQQFDERSISCIEKSANLGYPVALYAMGLFYDTGDFLGLDKHKAAKYFEAAAEKGHAHSMLIHGTGLLYGQHVYKEIQDENLGLEYIRKASELKCRRAIEFLIDFCEKGQFGYSVESEIYEKLKATLKADDLI